MGMNMYERELKTYLQLNTICEKSGVVFFGSTFAKEIPVGELKQSFAMDCIMYNRSFTDLSVFDAMELYRQCVKELEPRKVILQLGETDLEREYRSVSEIADACAKLVQVIQKENKGCTIVLLPVVNHEHSTEIEQYNKELEKLAVEHRCKYVNITAASSSNYPSMKAFSMLKPFVRERFSFADAMTLVSV